MYYKRPTTTNFKLLIFKIIMPSLKILEIQLPITKNHEWNCIKNILLNQE